MTIGDNNEAYYRHYGVPDAKMYRGCFPIDSARFQAATKGLTNDDRAAVRQRFGIAPDAVVALFVGKLIDIKRPFDLVDAVALLRERVPKLQALFIGSGPLENSLRQRIGDLDLETRVRLTGFINQSDMPAALWAGDLIAMCSDKDPHPLAVSEAMAMGNAVIASDRIGCVGPTDAARPNENALIYPWGDVAALADRLEQLVVDVPLREEMRRKSLELAATQDVTVAVGAVTQFLFPTANAPSS
jgi:glycosyltransferase involved in cell wall biosynthesis